MPVRARSPPQLETSVAPSPTRSERVTMENGILLPCVSRQHSKGWTVLMRPKLIIPESPRDTWEKQELHQNPQSSCL